MVFGVDPDRNGALMWSTRVGSGSTLGGVHWGISGDTRRAYVTISDHPRSDLPARFANRGRTPGVYALDLMSGDIVWSSTTPENVCGDRRGCFRGHSAAPTAIPGVVFAGSLDGWIRAHAMDTGRVLWEFDTARDFRGVNGIDGHGGAIDGPGPVVANGRLFVNSGYGLFTQMPGNLLLAFEAPPD
jgi:polyvinyl alcohol dehydrogenase (cytochrome)